LKLEIKAAGGSWQEVAAEGSFSAGWQAAVGSGGIK